MLAWLPYESPEAAEKSLGGIPDGVEVQCFTDPAGQWPDSIGEVEFLVPPYMTGATGLKRIAEMTNLKVVQLTTAGYEEVLPWIPEGVTLSNGGGIHDASTAEMALGLMLARGRRLDSFARSQSESQWSPQFGRALADQRVLIIGHGRIGKAIEARITPFEPASITRVARTARDGVHAFTELDELLPAADVVVVICPLTDETTGLLDAERLALLPDDALVVNVARGKVIDTDALVAELNSGRIQAAIDVVDPEPLPAEHPLWKCPNLLIAPHVGGWSTAYQPRADAHIARQLRTFAAGEELHTVVAGPNRQTPGAAAGQQG